MRGEGRREVKGGWEGKGGCEVKGGWEVKGGGDWRMEGEGRMGGEGRGKGGWEVKGGGEGRRGREEASAASGYTIIHVYACTLLVYALGAILGDCRHSCRLSRCTCISVKLYC